MKMMELPRGSFLMRSRRLVIKDAVTNCRFVFHFRLEELKKDDTTAVSAIEVERHRSIHTVRHASMQMQAFVEMKFWPIKKDLGSPSRHLEHPSMVDTTSLPPMSN